MYQEWDKWEKYNIKMRLKETAFRLNKKSSREGSEKKSNFQWTYPGYRSPYSD
jgi:hypothetical protein